MHASEPALARLKEKYPMLDCFTARPFGVEVEFYGLEYFITPVDNGIIKPYNVQSKTTDGRYFDDLLQSFDLSLGSDTEHWHLEEDHSITHRGGVELISPVLSGFEDLIDVYHFLQLLCSIDRLQVDESCGFHVHHGVNREVYDCENLRELIRVVYPMEDYIYLLIAGDRAMKETCRPMELDIKDILAIYNCDTECRSGCRLKDLWYCPANRHDPDCEGPERYDATRYHGLNLHSYWFRSTIEFRYHSAVLEQIDEAMQWILFTQFLVELSAGNVPAISYCANANKWMKAIYKIYLAFGHLNRIMT